MPAVETEQLREDRLLARRILEGDEAAFEQLFSDHFAGLYRFALARLRYDEALAKDVVQASVVSVIEAIDRYRGEAPLFTWMCSICRHEISAYFRRRKRAPIEVDLVEDKAEIQAVLTWLASGDHSTPEEALQRKEVSRLVHLALDHLPPRYGRALEWQYFDGLSVVEIADRLAVSAKAAESILGRARAAFRRGFASVSKGLDGRGYRGLRLAASNGMESGAR